MARGRPPAMFIADALALDFLNSVATPVDEPVDWIDDGEGLLAWLEQACLVPPSVLEQLRAQAMPGRDGSHGPQPKVFPLRVTTKSVPAIASAPRARLAAVVAALAELKPVVLGALALVVVVIAWSPW